MNKQNTASLVSAVFLLSCGLIAYQISLLQVLTFTQWYHFAYMIISVALLGWGCAGTFLTVFKKLILKNPGLSLQLFCLLSCASMVLNTYLFQFQGYFFDTSAIFTYKIDVTRLIITIVHFMLPFFFGALALGIVFTKGSMIISTVYCANLIGSGFGGLLIYVLSLTLMPLQISLMSAFLPLAAAYLFSKRTKLSLYLYALLTAVFATCFFFSGAPVMSQYKDLRKVLEMQGSKIVKTDKAPHAIVQTVSSEALRPSPCLSFTYSGEIPPSNAVFINGDSAGSIINFGNLDSMKFYLFTTGALSFAVGKPERILVLNAGSGSAVAMSLLSGAKTIDAVESDTILARYLKESVGKLSSSYDCEITIYSGNVRSFLQMVKGKYELIIVPQVNSFGENTGLNALDARYLMTKESFDRMFSLLSDKGMITVSSWQDYPPRYAFKIAATFADLLKRNGIKDPSTHIAAVQSWGDTSFILSKKPFSKAAIERIYSFCRKMQFDPIIFQHNELNQGKVYNLGNELFFTGLEKILAPESNFSENYKYNISPATDDSAYFSHFLRLDDISNMLNSYKDHQVSFIELGYMVLIFTILILFIAALLMIIAPLFIIGLKGERKFWTFFYFGGIGAGYMLTEMAIIEYFTFYLENPVFSVSLVICSMLIFSGIGSLSLAFIPSIKNSILVILGIIILILTAYAFILPPMLEATLGLSSLFKVAIALFLSGVPAYFMGFAFPYAIKFLSGKSSLLIPWGWSVNSFLSVICPPLAIALSIEFGFRYVLLTSAFFYCITLLSAICIRKS